MKNRILTAIVLTAALLAASSFGSRVAILSTAKAEEVKSQAASLSHATDLSARRRPRHIARTSERRDDGGYYYDRPVAYRPYPYALPVPFFLGFGFSPPW